MSDFDPLESLRAAWRAEAADLPPDALTECDAETQAAVRSLQSAWKQTNQEMPSVLPPPAIAARLERSGVLLPRKRPTLAWWSLAAALLLAWTMLIWQPWNSTRPTQPIDAVAEGGREAPVEPHSAQPLENPPSVEAPVDVPPWSLRPDGFERRAGSVRLVLLQPPPEPALSPTPEFNTTPDPSPNSTNGETL